MSHEPSSPHTLSHVHIAPAEAALIKRLENLILLLEQAVENLFVLSLSPTTTYSTLPSLHSSSSLPSPSLHSSSSLPSPSLHSESPERSRLLAGLSSIEAQCSAQLVGFGRDPAQREDIRLTNGLWGKRLRRIYEGAEEGGRAETFREGSRKENGKGKGKGVHRTETLDAVERANIAWSLRLKGIYEDAAEEEGGMEGDGTRAFRGKMGGDGVLREEGRR